MKTVKKTLCFLLLTLACSLSAQEVRDSVRIHFRQGKSNLDMSFGENRNALNRIADSLKTSYADSIYRLQRILVVGSASPEGSISLNKRLSEQRAETLFSYLSRYGTLPDSLQHTRFLGRDWNGLITRVENDDRMPYRDETLRLLRYIASVPEGSFVEGEDPLRRIQRLRGGEPYRYMYHHHFPELRTSRMYLWYRKVQNPMVVKAEPATVWILPDTIPAPVLYQETPCNCCCLPFYMAIKTNLLYDALLVPNIGVEFYLGRQWSVSANWMYSWWKTDRHHWYWRTYGGDLAVRKWLGKKAKEKPLQGHHLGVYGQMITYDFEWGGRGYLGDRWSWGVGLEYGYSLPIARRLNLDFGIGLGYLAGEYKKYQPIDDCYVWQSTRQRHYFGPTKAEVTLVWLIGCENYNPKKGGKR